MAKKKKATKKEVEKKAVEEVEVSEKKVHNYKIRSSGTKKKKPYVPKESGRMGNVRTGNASGKSSRGRKGYLNKY